MAKKDLCFVLFVSLGFVVFGQNASDFETKINNGSITITKYTGNATTLVIPDRISGLPVTGIGEEAFQGCSALTSITLPAGITSIETAAFYDCERLPDEIIAEIKRRFGEAPFYGPW